MRSGTIYINPSDEFIRAIIFDSTHKAAKWVKDDKRTVYFRPEDFPSHAYVAKMVCMAEYEKGLAVLD